MILCIDVGNSHIYGGVFDGDEIKLRFRHTSKVSTSDELGIFLKSVLRENNCSPETIRKIAICSVVPQVDYSLRSACVKYFSIDPFLLQAGVKTGLNIKYRNPIEVGADRIANAIAATHSFPNQNIIVIDFGTATTFCAISHKKAYLGGAILPGLRLSADALSKNTAKLPSVEIIKTESVVGRSTIESIQSGVYYGVLGACKELIQRIHHEAFNGDKTLILATGGFASLFDRQGLYDHLVPDLVLQGIRLAAMMNTA
ncbi:type III pantothenate kinase [Legionella pneumophila]|uniref:Type III pantothenate kinase n=1 Tax=Legionella pneumophila subsp. pascullei TaxID=91890 RepID=A0AAX2IUL9_LEGPN|nr:type III pantothenate kinase [Legionella pneumophila]AMP90381.1 type III pantothenate kinase [Legionella pneumophila subsp. pascullei]AMP91951.1 type III pantothenate kinase [Legionella pneumophila subsp. pascullei]AMP94917.1 type III pantothenate kinase [Legionella pneumophila subsp. pascullei]SQG89774.1 Bvg accessory factor [Legionella pneumophila subsp. pascullei]VEH05380.1 Bvg accessory factor [Legionella pneumophila subsp. pascullei]